MAVAPLPGVNDRAEPRPSSITLLARFPSAADAHRAEDTLVAEGLDEAALSTAPSALDTHAFRRTRALSALLGAGLGALVGGTLGLLTGALVHADRGLLANAELTGVLMGALMLGALGLFLGLGVGEARGVRRAKKEAPRDAPWVLRVEAPRATRRALRRQLRRLGAGVIARARHPGWA